ncbi:hypothetical protein B0H16DRAFT_1816465 [Mycena metata]|uniref:Uncharacterized protein n=1 Tax=Mycena metata TaxID=1033252 RepID=A0AAD7MD71_9AGAR|nr:hypothetical protein B0H16DRAFT_1816465 [Mycena metata]
MQPKFASLSVVLSALFASQLVGAIPNVDCSLVRCAAVKCPLGQTSQIKPGTCCLTCVPCGKVNCPLIRCAAPLASRNRIAQMSYASTVWGKSSLGIAALLADWDRQFKGLTLQRR